MSLLLLLMSLLLLLLLKNKSETRITANVLKQDPNAKKVKLSFVRLDKTRVLQIHKHLMFWEVVAVCLFV